MDIKEKYRTKAEEIAVSEYNKEFEELDIDTQSEIYKKAEELVGEDLQLAADNLREELKMEERKDG